MAINPNAAATARGAARNCQAESPAARVTINSEERVRRQNDKIPPKRTAKGRICMDSHGSFSAAISLTRPKPTLGRLAALRSSSRKSNNATSPLNDASITRTALKNCREKYRERVSEKTIVFNLSAARCDQDARSFSGRT